jgi:hypothetical protein
MQIAIVGWGSLIWRPGSLKLRTRWYRDGPMLPIEFARISKGDRLTLVLHPSSANQRTLWAIADSSDLRGAQENLKERESAPQSAILWASGSTYSPDVTASVKSAISDWLSAHPRIDGCLWTGLGSNWQEKREREFSVEDAVRYLSGLPDPERAREYLRNAPSQIQTEVRQAVRAQLNWSDAELLSELFEP